MVSYCSLTYLALFLPIAALIYGVMPKKLRPYVLLGLGFVFFWSISGKLVICLMLSVLSLHHTGLWLTSLQKERDALMAAPQTEGAPGKKEIRQRYLKKQRLVLCFAVALHIGMLAFYKYTGFFGGNLNELFRLTGIPLHMTIPSYAAPIGISFYTLQAVSYIFDVYREKIPADRHLCRLALYMAFFPTIVEGPICRYQETSAQLWSGEGIRYRNFVSGLQRIAFGLMKKIVVADRLNLLIKTVYANGTDYDGGIVALSAVCYTCQLYMEFSGTMDVVNGSAEIFGIKLPENFTQPFFSRTISEFWKRWHITLGTWFRDYVFYPLTMAKPLKKLTSHARKKIGNHYGPLIASGIALFCVWLGNGIWHGAGWNFIFFGMYHFVLILTGNIIEPLVLLVTSKLKINRSSPVYAGLQIVRTGILVCIGEMFFRAEGLRAGLGMFAKLFTDFSFRSFVNGGVLKLGMDGNDFIIVGVSVVLVLLVGIAREKKISIRGWISERNVLVRFAIYYAFIMFIVIFGAYGTGYVPIDPIYADF